MKIVPPTLAGNGETLFIHLVKESALPLSRSGRTVLKSGIKG
ncbi:MAG: hypothetical protein MPW15_09625 [Candidatus Manganitrophus sp.]|nr:hypothetical protein [Candidatus Manganitrophus sp.]